MVTAQDSDVARPAVRLTPIVLWWLVFIVGVGYSVGSAGSDIAALARLLAIMFAATVGSFAVHIAILHRRGSYRGGGA